MLNRRILLFSICYNHVRLKRIGTIEKMVLVALQHNILFLFSSHMVLINQSIVKCSRSLYPYRPIWGHLQHFCLTRDWSAAGCRHQQPTIAAKTKKSRKSQIAIMNGRPRQNTWYAMAATGVRRQPGGHRMLDLRRPCLWPASPRDRTWRVRWTGWVSGRAPSHLRRHPPGGSALWRLHSHTRPDGKLA